LFLFYINIIWFICLYNSIFTLSNRRKEKWINECFSDSFICSHGKNWRILLHPQFHQKDYWSQKWTHRLTKSSFMVVNYFFVSHIRNSWIRILFISVCLKKHIINIFITIIGNNFLNSFSMKLVIQVRLKLNRSFPKFSWSAIADITSSLGYFLILVSYYLIHRENYSYESISVGLYYNLKYIFTRSRFSFLSLGISLFQSTKIFYRAPGISLKCPKELR
jgi:hypothetical protein